MMKKKELLCMKMTHDFSQPISFCFFLFFLIMILAGKVFIMNDDGRFLFSPSSFNTFSVYCVCYNVFNRHTYWYHSHIHTYTHLLHTYNNVELEKTINSSWQEEITQWQWDNLPPFFSLRFPFYSSNNNSGNNNSDCLSYINRHSRVRHPNTHTHTRTYWK